MQNNKKENHLELGDFFISKLLLTISSISIFFSRMTLPLEEG